MSIGGRDVVQVPLEALTPADSPRLAGADLVHMRALAEVDEELPPILVHRPSMRVIDGAHRVGAARLRGERTIAAEFFDGSDTEAFILAVRMNITHGLPLSLADRKAAAARIVRECPEWSDRAIGVSTGLSHKTIGALRRSTGANSQSNVRIGRDGRPHSTDRTDGRRLASELIARAPGTPLREVAKAAGVSLGTAHDVRQRLRRGDDPIPGHRPSGPRTPAPAKTTDRVQIKDARQVIHRLKSDPSLRFTETGRALLRRLELYAMANSALEGMIDALPAHAITLIVQLAYVFADDWRRFAAHLEQRQNPTPADRAARQGSDEIIDYPVTSRPME